MALKPLRSVLYDDISAFMNETAERGRIVAWQTSTSGLGDMDDPGSVVWVPTGNVGVIAPAGMLMNDVVNLDLARTHLNEHQDEVQVGSKVTLMKRGFVRTNCIVAGVNPVPGSGAYMSTSGELTMTAPANPQALIGRFTSAKDVDGYAKVEVNVS
jgi:hypothetical protein